MTTTFLVVSSLVKVLVILLITVGAFAPVLIWAERRQSAMIQDRLGPRRAAIVLDIADIDGVVAKSKAAGLHVYDEEHLVTNDGREGREVGIVDFDDNLVVIYHITSAPQ